MKKLLLISSLLISFNFYAQFWVEQSTGFTDASRGLNSISIVDSDIAWASAYDGSGADPSAPITDFTKTIDGGQTWTPGVVSTDPNLRIAMISATSDQNAWAACFKDAAGSFNTGIFHTSDGGDTWAKQDTAPFSSSTSFPNVVHFWDDNTGFCQGDPVDGYYELYTTTDGGTTWIRVPSSNIPTPIAGEYGYVSQIFSAGGTRIWWTTNEGRIFRSDDYGLNWDVFQSPIPDFGGLDSSGELSFWDDNNGMMINQAGAIFHTTDGGENWSSVFPNSGEVFGSDISCIPGTNIVVSSGASHVTGSTDRGSSYSINNGLDWIQIDLQNHLDVTFKDATTGYAAGFSTDATTGGIFKYNTGLPLATNNNTITTFKAYPNPVKDNLTIEGVDTITNVSIFNMLGQKVLDVNPNTQNATINLENLNSGTYFTKVTINGAIETMKIIK